MSKAWIVEDDLWDLIEPLLPPLLVKSPGPRLCAAAAVSAMQ